MICPDIILSSDNLRLRRISLDDIPFVFSATRFEGFCDGMRWSPPASEEELISPYEANVRAWETGSGYTFTIEYAADSNRVGRIVIRRGEADIWDIGFWTHPICYGQGYMTEAVAVILRFGFTHLSASEIQASHAIWNRASRRVLEKAGFRFFRHVAEGFQKNGIWVEEELLSITRQQYQHRTEQPDI